MAEDKMGEKISNVIEGVKFISNEEGIASLFLAYSAE
jgi:hypothetical protein